MEILQLERITKTFGGLTAVNNLTFSVQEGEILGLIGPNGAGKTTVFNLITGYLRSSQGQAKFNGSVITNYPVHQITTLGIARTFQGSRVYRQLTVFEAIAIGCHSRTPVGFWQALVNGKTAKKYREENRKKVLDLLEFLGIASRENSMTSNLPYAHQSLVGIGMALATEPRLLLLDEPLAGMNNQETLETMELIKKIRNKGISILLVEHDMMAVMGTCDRIVVLDYGVKIAEGTPREIQNNPKVIEAYLGSDYDA